MKAASRPQTCVRMVIGPNEASTFHLAPSALQRHELNPVSEALRMAESWVRQSPVTLDGNVKNSR